MLDVVCRINGMFFNVVVHCILPLVQSNTNQLALLCCAYSSLVSYKHYFKMKLHLPTGLSIEELADLLPNQTLGRAPRKKLLKMRVAHMTTGGPAPGQPMPQPEPVVPYRGTSIREHLRRRHLHRQIARAKAKKAGELTLQAKQDSKERHLALVHAREEHRRQLAYASLKRTAEPINAPKQTPSNSQHKLQKMAADPAADSNDNDSGPCHPRQMKMITVPGTWIGMDAEKIVVSGYELSSDEE
jgi:hypothetical protein